MRPYKAILNLNGLTFRTLLPAAVCTLFLLVPIMNAYASKDRDAKLLPVTSKGYGLGNTFPAALPKPLYSENAVEKTGWDRLEGQPVNIAPWTYEWRADLEVQSTPEAYFIPRRLDRIDKVYRTAFYEMSEQELKSKYYPNDFSYLSPNLPDLLKPLLPKPKGSLLAGLLWTGGLENCQIELRWPDGEKSIPQQNDVEVRSYPTVFGWFGWTSEEILTKPVISEDGRVWTYKSGPATEMVAVFRQGDSGSVPSLMVTSPKMGVWKRMDLEIEWGFQPGTEDKDFGGCLESYISTVGPISPLAEDKGTKLKGKNAWRSANKGSARRGIVVPLLYTSDGRPALDSRVTVRGKQSSFTFRPIDVENGPMLIPQHGVFITKAGSGKTARDFSKELEAKNTKSIRQQTREHKEASSWDELMREVRLWTCPDGTAVPDFPEVGDPTMEVELPDPRWTDAWRCASFQLEGKHLWGGLAFEVGRVAHEMDLIGLHDEADKVYQHFLKAPGGKPDGDYSDGDGALEWATGMRHDMGYDHDGTHASTGRLLFAMADRYFLTGEKEWFLRNRARMQAAADWIIRQRTLYMKDIPNRRDLLVAGLLPPYMLGDYALPCCDWRWYYVDNALSLQGLTRFADALAEFNAKAGAKYRKAADAFRKDLLRAVEKDEALSPVRLGLNGAYQSYVSLMPYCGGTLACLEYGAPQRTQADFIMGALPLAEPFAALDASDYRMIGAIDVMEELGTSPAAVSELQDARKKKGVSADDAWFWNSFGGSLPKASHNANIYLLQDDAPNFLRFWMNSYAAMTGADGKLWEWGHQGEYTACSTPDNGTAGWFMENFRNLLVMEDRQALWIARATPRVWLEQGKRISVRNAPTYFGDLAYEIISDVDNGTISARIEIPTRKPPESVIIRFRHPKQLPMKSVLVNGKPWAAFDKLKETIELTGLEGTASVTASY